MSRVRVRVDVGDVIDDLQSDFRAAIRDTLNEVAPDANINEDEFLRAFKRAVGRRVGTATVRGRPV